MFLPLLLFCVFALLSAIGAFLVASHQRGRRAGVWGGLATLLFFAGLGWGLLSLLRAGGF